jgi:hypothetical protein
MVIQMKGVEERATRCSNMNRPLPLGVLRSRGDRCRCVVRERETVGSEPGARLRGTVRDLCSGLLLSATAYLVTVTLRVTDADARANTSQSFTLWVALPTSA